MIIYLIFHLCPATSEGPTHRIFSAHFEFVVGSKLRSYNYAIPSGKHLIGNGLEVFQYHNDPKHTANASEIIFGKKNS